jgi:hypothetical protein
MNAQVKRKKGRKEEKQKERRKHQKELTLDKQFWVAGMLNEPNTGWSV